MDFTALTAALDRVASAYKGIAAHADSVETATKATVTHADKWQTAMEAMVGVGAKLHDKVLATKTALESANLAVQAAMDREAKAPPSFAARAEVLSAQKLAKTAAAEHESAANALTKRQEAVRKAALKETFKAVVTDSPLVWATKQEFAFQQAVAGANAAVEVRTQLYQTGLRSAEATGQSVKEAGTAQTALLRAGQLYFGSVDTGLAKVASQTTNLSRGLVPTTASLTTDLLEMHSALGTNYDDTARLAAVTKSIGQSWVEVRDVVTTVAQRTALTATEAEKAATFISRTAYGTNRPGDTAGSTRAVLALESSIKALGGNGSVVEGLVGRLSHIGQAGGLGLAFGSGGLDFASDPARLKQVLGNIAAWLKPARDNAIVLESLASTFGLTREEAQDLINGMDQLKVAEGDLATHSKTLSEVYAEQSARTGTVWGQLKTGFQTLFIQVLQPLTSFVDNVVNKTLASLNASLGSVSQATDGWVSTILSVTLGAYGAVTAFKALGSLLGLFGVGGEGGLLAKFLPTLGPVLLRGVALVGPLLAGAAALWAGQQLGNLATAVLDTVTEADNPASAAFEADSNARANDTFAAIATRASDWLVTQARSNIDLGTSALQSQVGLAIDGIRADHDGANRGRRIAEVSTNLDNAVVVAQSVADALDVRMRELHNTDEEIAAADRRSDEVIVNLKDIVKVLRDHLVFVTNSSRVQQQQDDDDEQKFMADTLRAQAAAAAWPAYHNIPGL